MGIQQKLECVFVCTLLFKEKPAVCLRMINGEEYSRFVATNLKTSLLCTGLEDRVNRQIQTQYGSRQTQKQLSSFESFVLFGC